MSANLQIYLLVQELLKALQQVQSDPKAFEANVKKAYEISAAQKAKLDEARDTIAKAKAATGELNTKQIEHDNAAKVLAQRQSDLDNQAARHQAIEAEHAKTKEALAAQAEQQKAADAKNKQTAKLLDDRTAQLVANEKKLAERADALDVREKNIAAYNKKVEEYEKSLKFRAAELRKQTEGL